MLMEMLALITIGLVGGFAFLVCYCEKHEKKETEIEEKATTCLMETIEVPQIASYGYYNEYGAWVDQDLEREKRLT